MTKRRSTVGAARAFHPSRPWPASPSHPEPAPRSGGLAAGSALGFALRLAVSLTALGGHADGAEGYRARWEVDGATVTLESGPSGMFGNAGGPFLLTFRKNGIRTQKIIGLNPAAIALEIGNPSRLWGYMRTSGSSGVLTSTELDAGMHEESLVINPGDSGSELGNRVYHAVFSTEFLLKLDRVADYTVPDAPGGVEWGK